MRPRFKALQGYCGALPLSSMEDPQAWELVQG